MNHSTPDNSDIARSKNELSCYQDIDLIGQKVAGHWQIVAMLGKNAISTVYKAQDRSTGKAIILKLIHKSLTSNIVNIKRLEQKAKELIALNHEHISNFYDVYISPQQEFFLFCDYYVSETLAEMLAKCGHISVERATRIFAQAAEALDYAHKQKILHQDIKPNNICLINDQYNVDDVKIVDFGIAKLISEESQETKSSRSTTLTGEIFGSVLYMSPEECTGKKVDSRADIYSLGCVMYEAINGKPPFVGKNVMETTYKHMNELPMPLTDPSLSGQSVERYQAVIFKAIKKKSQERYQSMLALKDDLMILEEASNSQWQSNAHVAHGSKRYKQDTFTNRQTTLVLLTTGLTSCLMLCFLAISANFMLNSFDSEDYPKFNNNLLWISEKKQLQNRPANFTTQRETLLQSLDLIEHSKTKYSIDYEEHLAKLCSLYMKSGSWPEAAHEIDKLIDVQSRVKGPINLAQAYANLAICYFWQGNFDKAQELSLTALTLTKRTNVEELLAEDTSLAILGDIYIRKMNNAQAKATYLKLYGLWDKSKQKYPAHYALASVMLADTYRREGHLPEAEQFYRNALHWWQNYVGHHESFVPKAYYGLGLVLKGEHRYQEALHQFSYALQMTKNATGVPSLLIEAIGKESSDCLFHTDFWAWLHQKFKL